MHDDELEAMVQQLADLLATAPQELRSKFRYLVEDFTAPMSAAGKQEAERRLRQTIAELKAAKGQS